MGLCLVVVMAITSAVPLFADDSSDVTVLSYTLSDEEMLAFLSTCTAKYTLFASGGSYTGSCNFVHDSNSDSPGYYVLDWSTSGGAGVVATFDLDFSLSLTASSISIEHFACTVYGNNISFTSVKAQSLSCKVNSSCFPSDSVSFDANYNLKGSLRSVLANRSTFDFNPSLSVNSFSASFDSSYPMQQYVYVYYGIKSITYTAPAPLVYELQDAVKDIIKNGDKNTERIIQNFNNNTQTILEELGDQFSLSRDQEEWLHQEDMTQREELTDKIIGSLDTPSDEQQSQVDDFSNQIDETDKKLDDLAEDMHIDVPDLSTDLDLSIIDDNLDFEVISPVFNAIFGYPWVITMIVLSFIFSVVGIVIHGKYHE